MKRKIQGTEHEYTLYCETMQSMGMDPHALALDILRRSNLHAAGEFTTNQSRAYLDCGHLELSTCETGSFRDLLVWEKAGEKIVDWLRKKVEEERCSGKVRVWAYKNNTSPDGTAYGSHENYCVSRTVAFPERFEAELVPHLVTRLIYTGAGDILDGKYVLSPSAYKTGALISSDTMHNTGVLNTRDEPHAQGAKYRRLHLQIGDALMNETAILLRNFTTSAVLQLMEENMLNDAPRLARPVEDMWKIIENTNPDKWKLELTDGKTVSPVDIQEYYLGKIEVIVETDIEKRALGLLDEILGLFKRKDGKKLSRKVEWLDRYYAIQGLSEDDDIGSKAAMKVCKRYSELGEDRGIYYDRRRKGLIDRILTDDRVLSAIAEPPGDTRAHARKALCEKYGPDVVDIDWSCVTVSVSGVQKTIELEEPGDPNANIEA
jgi:proteasome accessory factor A